MATSRELVRPTCPKCQTLLEVDPAVFSEGNCPRCRAWLRLVEGRKLEEIPLRLGPTLCTDCRDHVLKGGAAPPPRPHCDRCNQAMEDDGKAV